MKLEHLCDMELGYQGGFTLIQPYASEEGTGFGVGEGMVSGTSLPGAPAGSIIPSGAAMAPCSRMRMA